MALGVAHGSEFRDVGDGGQFSSTLLILEGELFRPQRNGLSRPALLALRCSEGAQAALFRFWLPIEILPARLFGTAMAMLRCRAQYTRSVDVA